MPIPTLDDRALDALLSGSPSPQAGFDWLVPLVDELGQVSSGPAPAMGPALATLLAEGFSPLEAAVQTAPVTVVPEPAYAPVAERARARGRGRLVARLAGLGLVAKVALGVGLAAAGTTAAGAAGVLPRPAQDAVAKAVQVATPFTFPDSASGKAVVDVPQTLTTRPGPAASVPGVIVPGAPGVEGSSGNGVSVGANQGATGLDRAGQTPAAGHVPTSLPAAGGAGGRPADPGAPATKGLDTAGTTPAAGRVPTSVPPTTTATPTGAGRASQGSNGTGTAATTPAADRAPTTPGRP